MKHIALRSFWRWMSRTSLRRHCMAAEINILCMYRFSFFIFLWFLSRFTMIFIRLRFLFFSLRYRFFLISWSISFLCFYLASLMFRIFRSNRLSLLKYWFEKSLLLPARSWHFSKSRMLRWISASFLWWWRLHPFFRLQPMLNWNIERLTKSWLYWLFRNIFALLLIFDYNHLIISLSVHLKWLHTSLNIFRSLVISSYFWMLIYW